MRPDRPAPVLLAALLIAAACSGGTVSEGFERDPRWDGARNRLATEPRVKQQDFGWQRSNHAGKAPGEIGGRIWRSVTPAYYAKKLPTLTLDDRLTASGSLALLGATVHQGYQTGSTIFIGFFNHREQGWRPPNFLGFRLESFNEPDGAILELSYGTSRWTAGGAFLYKSGAAAEVLVRDLDQQQLLRIPPDGSRHTWSVRYDPKGGGGSGEITLAVDGIAAALRIGPEHRRQGARFDRFGIFNNQLDGNDMTAYFDDVTVNGELSNFSSPRGWEGEGNRDRIVDRARYGRNDFGYSPTNHAGGKRGEIGGRFWRVEAEEPQYQGYYGGDVGQLTLDDRLSAKGRIAFPRFSVDSGMHFGWFSSRGQGWPPKNFVGVYVDSLSSVGRIFTPMYGTSRAALTMRRGGRFVGAAHSDRFLLFLPNGRPYEWTLSYDPAANGGSGSIALTLGEERTTLDLDPGARAEGAEMDRFGIFNMQDNNGKDCLVYLDDLVYTTGRATP